jgi:hypothetical protein
MIFISHRGNLYGQGGENWENHPDYINEALKEGFDVEIDVWLIGQNKLFLGHDEPKFEISEPFLRNMHLWCHAKNEPALEFMLNHNFHCFWHETDKYTLTSKGFIWSYPGSPALHNSIILEWGDQLSPIYKNTLNNIKGICSDNIKSIKKQILNSNL